MLIFVQSKGRAKELFSELVYDGINVDVIHAERSKKQRDDVVKQFRLGSIWVLIATDLMARGVDFKGVNMVRSDDDDDDDSGDGSSDDHDDDDMCVS